ncbi:MAG: AAA family ATPase [Dehalococcoidia bacterium]
MEQIELIRGLAVPGVLPGSDVGIEVRETHASVVFMTRERAYKLKKAVNFGFLDYSTARRRRLMCEREVALNRRLAPNVYEGVIAVREGPGGGVAIGGHGRVIDHLVVMRRLDDRDSLAAMVRDGRAGEAECRAVARVVAAFHRDAKRGEPRRAMAPAVRVNVMENFGQLRAMPGVAMPGPWLELLEHRARQFLRGERTLLAARAANGVVRECHGDLRAEHVYLERGGVAVIDCIEFSRRLREIDSAADIAFLVMDVAAMGRPRAAEAVAEEYRARSGDGLDGVLRFYGAYRAVVRAKVAALRAGELADGDPAREASAIEARRYAWTALRFATGVARPAMVIVGGLTGTGKSWLARPLSEALAAEYVNADEVRKRMAGIAPGEHVFAGPDQGLYRAEMNAAVYAAMRERARVALAEGRNVVLDATFRRPEERAAAAEVAVECGAAFLAVECEAPPGAVRARLERRVAEASDPWSDGRWEVYAAQAAAARPWTEAGCMRVETTGERIAVVDGVLVALAERVGFASA